MWVSVRFGWGAMLVVVVASAAQAQPVITAPSSGQTFRSGPDYATDVLQDPWDFSNHEDISPNPDEFGGWTGNAWYANGTGPAFINAGAGRFVGTAAGDDQLMLLHRGDAIGLNPGRTGINYPIDTGRFRKLAVKMRVTGAPANQQLVAYWYHDSYAAANYLNRAAGIVFPEAIPSGTSEQIYVFDLTQAGSGGSQLVPACGGGGACSGVPAPWANEGQVRGLRLDPVSSFAQQGIEIDWVRLTASNSQSSAALMSVNLGSCSSFSHLSVTDAGGVAYTVTDSTGSNSQRSFNYGVLPPGTYTLRAVCANGTSSGTTFRINTPPAVTVIDPDVTGAPSTDYAALARGGDRWDFEQPTDLASVANVSLTGGVCAGGGCGFIPSDRPGAAPGSRMLRASSVGSNPSQLGDPALELLNGAIPPLSGTRHQYVTFSLRLHRPYDVGVGSVARLLWGSQSFADGSVITHTQDMRVWPGFGTYTIDLASLTPQNGGIETECPTCPTTPWPARSIRFLRIDPHEFGDAPTGFDVDDVSLTAPDEVALGQQFAVRYRFTDADTSGSSYTARIYIETWPQRTGRALLHTANNVSPNAELQYQFNPQASSVPPGRYSIYAEITETQGAVQQVSGAYATGPLAVYSTTATSPQISVSAPGSGQLVGFPFTITGCAFDQGANTGGINMDDVAVYAVAGPGVRGYAAGTTLALGFGNGSGTLQYAPITGSAVTCESVSNPASPYRNAGFRIVDVGLEQGPWTLKTFARSTITGQLTALGDIPVQVTQMTLPPQNFQATASGNAATISFQAPAGGPAVGGYAIDGSLNPEFSPALFTVVVPAPGSYSGSLASGTYYLRVRSLAVSGAPGMSSETRAVTLGSASVAPPGQPTLSMAQAASNPVTITWSPGPGGTPTSYTLYAGTSPGASNLAVASMGTATSLSTAAPVGTPIYLRVVASNAAGSAMSNEVYFTVAPPTVPGPPALSPAAVSGRTVTLSWAPPASGGVPAGYVVLARLPGSPAVVASLPVAGTSISVPAPPGTFIVSVVGTNAAGAGAESNQITVVVP